VGAVVLDSSFVLAAMDTEDAHHEAAAVELRRMNAAKTKFILPVVVLSEVLVGSARQSDEMVTRRRAMLLGAFGHSRVIDDEVAVQAAKLRAQHRSLRLPDALVIATGIVDDAEVILTGDKRWAGVDQRVRVLG
jgi:predicted nucleic acid-binding protein